VLEHLEAWREIIRLKRDLVIGFGQDVEIVAAILEREDPPDRTFMPMQ
jgi:hypothetical protein